MMLRKNFDHVHVQNPMIPISLARKSTVLARHFTVHLCNRHIQGQRYALRHTDSFRIYGVRLLKE